jgi:hypothetical protein
MDEGKMDGATDPDPRESTTVVAGGNESREQSQDEARLALERALGDHGRAAVILVEVDANYLGKARNRMHQLLQDWPQHRSEQLYLAAFGRGGFALVVAPIGYPAHARTLAEQLTRSLDPRLCPLLRRALPYAWFGVGLYSDDGEDAMLVVRRAEQALEHARTAGAGCGKVVLARRRHLAASLLRPEGAR